MENIVFIIVLRQILLSLLQSNFFGHFGIKVGFLILTLLIFSEILIMFTKWVFNVYVKYRTEKNESLWESNIC